MHDSLDRMRSISIGWRDPTTVHEDAKEWELEFTCSSSLTDEGRRLDVHPERREREFARYRVPVWSSAKSPETYLGCFLRDWLPHLV